METEASPPSAANEGALRMKGDKFLRAERKNALERQRFDRTVRSLQRERSRVGSDITRSMRSIVASFKTVMRTSGHCPEALPPSGPGDRTYEQSRYCSHGIRLSEKRIREWKETEKHLVQFMVLHNGHPPRAASAMGYRFPDRAASAASHAHLATDPTLFSQSPAPFQNGQASRPVSARPPSSASRLSRPPSRVTFAGVSNQSVVYTYPREEADQEHGQHLHMNDNPRAVSQVESSNGFHDCAGPSAEKLSTDSMQNVQNGQDGRQCSQHASDLPRRPYTVAAELHPTIQEHVTFQGDDVMQEEGDSAYPDNGNIGNEMSPGRSAFKVRSLSHNASRSVVRPLTSQGQVRRPSVPASRPISAPFAPPPARTAFGIVTGDEKPLRRLGHPNGSGSARSGSTDSAISSEGKPHEPAQNSGEINGVSNGSKGNYQRATKSTSGAAQADRRLSISPNGSRRGSLQNGGRGVARNQDGHRSSLNQTRGKSAGLGVRKSMSASSLAMSSVSSGTDISSPSLEEVFVLTEGSSVLPQASSLRSRSQSSDGFLPAKQEPAATTVEAVDSENQSQTALGNNANRRPSGGTFLPNHRATSASLRRGSFSIGARGVDGRPFSVAVIQGENQNSAVEIENAGETKGEIRAGFYGRHVNTSGGGASPSAECSEINQGPFAGSTYVNPGKSRLRSAMRRTSSVTAFRRGSASNSLRHVASTPAMQTSLPQNAEEGENASDGREATPNFAQLASRRMSAPAHVLKARGLLGNTELSTLNRSRHNSGDVEENPAPGVFSEAVSATEVLEASEGVSRRRERSLEMDRRASTGQIYTLANAARAVHAFSKTARKKALEALVQENSPDAQEVMRKRRIEQLKTRQLLLTRKSQIFNIIPVEESTNGEGGEEEDFD